MNGGKKRYYTIDFFKFAFALVIAVFHIWAYYQEPARGGFIGVEFFFMVSGFMLMKHYQENPNQSPSQYMVLRIRRLYPHYLFSFMIIFLYVNIVMDKSSIKAMAYNFFSHFSEIFMMSGTILSDEKTYLYNGVTWYISVMLISTYMISTMLIKHKDAVINWAPLIGIWTYMYIIYTEGTLNIWRPHIAGILNLGILRAIAGMLLGITAYTLKDKIVEALSVKDKKIGGGYCFSAV